jgi:hypothetical protein
MIQPRYKKYKYSVSDEGYYQLISKPFGAVKIPSEFKIEEVWRKEVVSAPYAIRGYKKGKKDTTLFTGLRPAFGQDDWYYGDNKGKDYILTKFNADKSECTMIEFPNFYPHKMEYRIEFTLKFISFYQGDLF